jgi:hypothetical protein
MKTSSLLRTSTVLALCLVVTVPAFPQGSGQIGPSKGEIAGIIVGVAAAITVVGFVVYHETHKHATVTGCVTAEAAGLSLKNEKDAKVYVLSGDSAALKAGEHVTLKGKKKNDSSEKRIFEVEKLTKDYGACHP